MEQSRADVGKKKTEQGRTKTEDYGVREDRVTRKPSRAERTRQRDHSRVEKNKAVRSRPQRGKYMNRRERRGGCILGQEQLP